MPVTNRTTTTRAEAHFARDLPDRYKLRARFALDHISGNRRPHFSITAELLNLRRRGDNRIEACGQLTDDIRRWLPDLTPWLPIHLADDEGTPMYAVQNGAYWLGLSDPRYLPDDTPQLGTFARLWRVDKARARELYDYARNDPNPTEALHFLAKQERPRWAEEARAALSFIEAHA